MKMTSASSASSNGGPDAASQYDAIADLYDGYPGSYLEDILFFVEEAKRSGSPVLELGVGTGRLAFCLAAVGLDVVGIDSSQAMLRALERRRSQVRAVPGQVRVLAADMRAFAVRKRFRTAIIAFRTFLYLLTPGDQRRALLAVRRHLASRGRLMMSFFVPREEMISRGRTRPREVARFPAPDGTGAVAVSDWTEFRPDTQRVVSHITYEWRNGADRVTRQQQHALVARYVFPNEVPPLLESCGYRVVAAYGGFDRQPLDGDSREQIWLAQPTRKREKKA
jgi:SAM-dependent methyltransferase